MQFKLGRFKNKRNSNNRPSSYLQGHDKGNLGNELNGEQRLRAILADLDKMVGLNSIKEMIRELKAFVDIQHKRAQEGLINEANVLHMIFKGNPGTGKSTIARLIGRFFKEMGVLSQGHLVEVERADLVGEYIGHTAHKAREQLKKAAGGILFIDEAYSLARGGERDFGREAIDVLVKGMEDHRHDFILILAGYKDEMAYFLETNPGLRSRFPIQLEFPDYNVQELLAIAQLMLAERQYNLTSSALIEMEKILRHKTLVGHRYSGNARLVRNIIERAVRRQALRLSSKKNLTRQQLMSIEKEDFLVPTAKPVLKRKEGSLSTGPSALINYKNLGG